MHTVGVLIYPTVGSEYDAAIDYETERNTDTCPNKECQYVCECHSNSDEVCEKTHSRMCVIQ